MCLTYVPLKTDESGECNGLGVLQNSVYFIGGGLQSKFLPMIWPLKKLRKLTKIIAN